MSRRSRREESGIPSQWTVPEQRRFAREDAANMSIETTALPSDEVNSGLQNFPMPKPAPPGSESLYYGEKSSEFITESHTNGKK